MSQTYGGRSVAAKQPDIGFAFSLPPERAVRYFESLGYDIPQDWPQRAQEAAAKARTIAGIYQQDAVRDIYQAIEDSARKGTPYAKFAEDVQKRLQARDLQWDKSGDMIDRSTGEIVGESLTPARLQTVYRTNMQSAFMAGRWQELQETKAWMPYLQYTAVMDSRTRAAHRALHGQVYHIDDPFWDAFYPPNGFNCRCTVTAYSARDLERKGLDASDGGARLEEVQRVVNRKGDTEPATAVRLPDGRRFLADRGFEGNVGRRHLAHLGQMQLERAAELPPRVAAMAVTEAYENPLLRQAVSDDLYQSYLKLAEAGQAARPQNRPLYVGALPLPVLDALETIGVPLPQSAIVASSDTLLRHSLRDVKQHAGKTLPHEFWRDSVDRLRQPSAVYFQPASGKQNRALLYFYDDPDNADGLYKVVVALDYDGFKRSKNPVSGRRENLVLNVIDTGSKIDKAGVGWHLYRHLLGVKY